MSTPASPNRTRLYLILLVVGAVLVAGTVVMLRRNVSAPTDAGSLPTTSAATTATTATTAIPASTAAAGAPTTGRALTPSTSSPARSTPPRTELDAAPASTQRATSPIPKAVTTAATGSSQGSAPAVLHLPSLHVTAAVDRVESIHGVLQVPDDISRVGWWLHSVPPGSATGSTVIDGHIDSAVDGEGALFHLADLNPGDPVTVTTGTGTTIRYRVQARRVYVKEQGLPAELFNQQGPARLVIISCGGQFDSSTRSYQDNIVIFSTPA